MGLASYMNSQRVNAMVQTLILSYVLVLAGLLIHEGMHLVVLSMLGEQGVMLVVPWRMALINFYISGLHVQPTRTLSLFSQLLFLFLGPSLAALPFAFLAYHVKERIPRTALIANVFVLLFFAVLETGDQILESTSKLEVSILGSPEFNIGVSLIILLLFAYKRIWKGS